MSEDSFQLLLGAQHYRTFASLCCYLRPATNKTAGDQPLVTDPEMTLGDPIHWS